VGFENHDPDPTVNNRQTPLTWSKRGAGETNTIHNQASALVNLLWVLSLIKLTYRYSLRHAQACTRKLVQGLLI